MKGTYQSSSPDRELHLGVMSTTSTAPSTGSRRGSITTSTDPFRGLIACEVFVLVFATTAGPKPDPSHAFAIRVSPSKALAKDTPMANHRKPSTSASRQPRDPSRKTRLDKVSPKMTLTTRRVDFKQRSCWLLILRWPPVEVAVLVVDMTPRCSSRSGLELR